MQGVAVTRAVVQRAASVEVTGGTDTRLQWLPSIAMAAGAVFVAASLWLALCLLPAMQGRSALLEWPHDWHAWLLQFSAAAVALAACATHRSRVSLLAWWDAATAPQRAAALCSGLLAVELSLGLGFWITKDAGVSDLGYLRAFFWLGGEFRPASLFSTLQLWLLAALAWTGYQGWRARGESRPAFAIAAAVGLFLGADELLGIHEWLGHGLLSADETGVGEASGTIGVGTVQAYGWTLIYFPLAVGVGALLSRRFWRELPHDGSFVLLVLASVLFLAGAVGVETLNSNAVAHGHHDINDAGGHLYLLVEEMLEMVAVTLAVFVFARCRFKLQALSGQPWPKSTH